MKDFSCRKAPSLPSHLAVEGDGVPQPDRLVPHLTLVYEGHSTGLH